MRTFRLIALFLSVVCLCCACKSQLGSEEASDEPPKNETFWQLPDDSNLHVKTEPWPPRAGPVLIRAVADFGDSGFVGVKNVEYRLVPSGQAPGGWQPMSRTKFEAEEEAIYEARPSIGRGKVAIQLRVTMDGNETVELTDWTVDVGS